MLFKDMLLSHLLLKYLYGLNILNVFFQGFKHNGPRIMQLFSYIYFLKIVLNNMFLIHFNFYKEQS